MGLMVTGDKSSRPARAVKRAAVAQMGMNYPVLIASEREENDLTYSCCDGPGSQPLSINSSHLAEYLDTYPLLGSDTATTELKSFSIMILSVLLRII